MKISAYHPFRSAKAKAEYLALYDEKAKAWPVASECRMIDTSYGQTFVRISGPVDAPPLVLLPGAGTCSLVWLPNIESLSESHRTYAVDTIINLPGCVGRSVYTRTIKSPSGIAKWLDELFNALKLGDKINLVGLSYGGWLTSQYALHSPDRLDRIVLVSPAATVLPIRLGFLLRMMLVALLPFRCSYKRFMYWVSKDGVRKNAQAAQSEFDDFMVAVRCFKPINQKHVPAPTVLTDDELQSIKVPALVLIGENEVHYSAQKAIHRLNTVAPQIQAEGIPHAGHDLVGVQVETVNQKILEFLAQS